MVSPCGPEYSIATSRQAPMSCRPAVLIRAKSGGAASPGHVHRQDTHKRSIAAPPDTLISRTSVYAIVKWASAVSMD